MTEIGDVREILWASSSETRVAETGDVIYIYILWASTKCRQQDSKPYNNSDINDHHSTTSVWEVKHTEHSDNIPDDGLSCFAWAGKRTVV